MEDSEANRNQSERHSQSHDPDLISDPAERALAEARNSLRQYDVGMEILDGWLEHGTRNFRLRISHLLTLNRVALEGINRYAGTFRPAPVRITGAAYEPPEPTKVPLLVEDFCEYINNGYVSKSAVHLAAFALWRLNWIHPFSDGNGRTARIVSYIVLCARLGYKLPGVETIPEQIAKDKRPYYAALENADAAFRTGRIDVSLMEKLIEECLANQLLTLHDFAVSSRIGSEPSDPQSGTEKSLATLQSDVEYRFPDQIYRPVYIVSMPDLLKTFKEEGSQRRSSWFEENPTLVTAIAVILAAVITAILTWAVAQ